MKKSILDSVVKDLLSITPSIRRSIQRKVVRTAFSQVEEDITLPHLEIMKILKEEGITTFQVTGKTSNKNEIIDEFKKSEDQSALILSPIGERDLDLPQTELIIVYDLVNSPKTVYQKMKRGRGGKVFLLFYNNTSEKQKVKNVVSEIAVRYPWSLIFFSDEEKKL